MLRTRLLTAAVLVPIAVCLIWIGGLPFLAFVALLLTIAEVEFCKLAARSGFRPALGFGICLLWLFLLEAQFSTFRWVRPGMSVILLASLVWQLFHRQGSPVADWSLTLAGGLYLGVCGASLVQLRALRPDGLWWMMTAMPAIISADTGAYFYGRALGRHKLAPTLSPGKTWEGYVAGVIVGGLVAALLASLWRVAAGATTAVSGWHGFVLGGIIGILAPLGDLAVSMMKREAGAKDSGSILPGHGGALDRVDSILWAAVIGYYYVLWCTP